MVKKQLLIIYAGYTDDGATSTIAKWIASGASTYVRTIIKKASETTIEDVANADGYVLGSGVYNGNPEPEMIEWSENVLNAGKNKDALNLSDRFVGTFCTSGGYTTGSQPTLNALARILMTFGASYIGGGNWHTGQGVCGMVNDDPKGGWKWDDYSIKHIQKESVDYGKRLGAITSFYQDSYNSSIGNPPSKPQQVITCKDDPKKVKKGCNAGMLLYVLAIALVIFLIVILISKRK